MTYLPNSIIPQAVGLQTINGLGDSITAQSQYQPSSVAPVTAPGWAQGATYAVGQMVGNGGYTFVCSVAGTSASTGIGPVPSTGAIADGTATWTYRAPISTPDSFLGCVAMFSGGALVFDQTQGYAGPPNSIRRIIVSSGGSGYVSPVIICNQGASATATVTGGVITAVSVTNPGNGNSAFSATVSDAGGGAGAVLSVVQDGSGTFGVFGCQTADMIARLPDCLSSTIQVFVVLGGSNDIVSGTPYATIIANLRIIYEALMNARRRVIAVPILPRTTFNAAQGAAAMRVNNWIRAYCRGELFANPSGHARIALADCTGLFQDGTNLGLFYPIGGTSGTAAAVTIDGVHPNTRGRQYMGAVIWQAAQRFTGPPPLLPARSYGALNGYDAILNPGGNAMEGLPWVASTAYTPGALRSNSGNVYVCTAAGISAVSGGPAGTSSSITDNGATWRYCRPAGMSVFGSGSTALTFGGTGASGITASGNLATGYTLVRTGSAATTGSVVGTVESPWSDGHVGNRQSLAFSLANGSTAESWAVRALYGVYALAGLTSADFGVTALFAECELELSGIANLSNAYLSLSDAVSGLYAYAGSTTTGTSGRVIGATGDVLPLPNNGKLLLRSAPIVPPPNLVNLNLILSFGLDSSGTTAGSAAAMVKINYMAVKRAGAA